MLMIGTGSPAVHRRQKRLEEQGFNVIRRSPDVFSVNDISELGRPEVDRVVDAVFICLSNVVPSQVQLTSEIVALCKRKRVPVTVADQPDLCTLSFLSTYKDGDFEIGITTNGKGCRLANRLKRHIVSTLPENVNSICQTVGDLRSQLSSLDQVDHDPLFLDDEDVVQPSTFNELTISDSKDNRMRFLTQVVEYYPLNRLADIDLDDLTSQYIEYSNMQSKIASECELAVPKFKRGRISLVGAGPGSQDLLTVAAFNAIKNCHVVLADKLVPEQVLQLVPKQTPVHIAKKFPGNADRAQQEFLSLALENLKNGLHVVRLKQGDPYIFGRGAEEYLYFRDHGYEPQVLPGITSALSGPLLANISPTHRNVADQILICTGTGRGGSLPHPPHYVESQTTVFLMALHRISEVVKSLLSNFWDPQLACAVIERASCPDQRVIRTTLNKVCQVIALVGSRPPGILVVGNACKVIHDLQGDYVIEEFGNTIVKSLTDDELICNCITYPNVLSQTCPSGLHHHIIKT